MGQHYVPTFPNQGTLRHHHLGRGYVGAVQATHLT